MLLAAFCNAKPLRASLQVFFVRGRTTRLLAEIIKVACSAYCASRDNVDGHTRDELLGIYGSSWHRCGHVPCRLTSTLKMRHCTCSLINQSDRSKPIISVVLWCWFPVLPIPCSALPIIKRSKGYLLEANAVEPRLGFRGVRSAVRHYDSLRASVN